MTFKNISTLALLLTGVALVSTSQEALSRTSRNGVVSTTGSGTATVTAPTGWTAGANKSKLPESGTGTGTITEKRTGSQGVTGTVTVTPPTGWTAGANKSKFTKSDGTVTGPHDGTLTQTGTGTGTITPPSATTGTTSDASESTDAAAT